MWNAPRCWGLFQDMGHMLRAPATGENRLVVAMRCYAHSPGPFPPAGKGNRHLEICLGHSSRPMSVLAAPVIPAKAGIRIPRLWMPAYAGEVWPKGSARAPAKLETHPGAVCACQNGSHSLPSPRSNDRFGRGLQTLVCIQILLSGIITHDFPVDCPYNSIHGRPFRGCHFVSVQVHPPGSQPVGA
jgi:hypothetical protein